MARLSGSPGVFDNEYDLSQIIPQVATTEAGFVGEFKWGPVGVRKLVGSEPELRVDYYMPTSDNFVDWFSAANFLGYSNKLWLVRIVDSTNANTSLRAKNATSNSASGFLVKNENEFTANYADGSLDTAYGTGPFIARYPGKLGNSLKVVYAASANAFTSTLSGTLSTTLGSTTVTGVGTSFTDQITSNDILYIDKKYYTVQSVTNTTSLILKNRVSKTSSGLTVKRLWSYYNEFNSAPTTTAYVADRGGSNDAIHVLVIDADGSWSGTAGTVLEKWANLSVASNAKTPEGENNFYKEVINQGSRYIYSSAHPTGFTNIGGLANTAFSGPLKPISITLQGGSDGQASGDDEYINGYDLFADKETSDISLLITGSASPVVTQYIFDNICEKRKDVVAVVSPPESSVVNNSGDEVEDIVAYRNSLSSTSYAIIDSGYKYQYDKYNDLYRWVPLNADVAGLMARTDEIRDPWWSPAGFNRGHVNNVVKLAFNPKEFERDVLYKSGVNSVVTFPGEGTVLYGDKTMQVKESAFDRINVRRLFIVLRKAISKAAKYTLFELNDDFTRATFRNMVNPYLRDVKGRRGIYDFKVICDITNNTPEVIDRNEFKADILIKPAKSINYITLNFVATRTGINFDEIPPGIF